MKASPIHQLLLLSFTILSIVFSVTTAAKVEFAYVGEKGPAFWHQLEGSSSLCLEGLHQSPIDIIPTDYSKSQIHPPSDVRVKDVEEAELAHI
ncbi:22428_t:CDS:1, partial [Racocetra persica]